MYEVYHYLFTSKNWTPVQKPTIKCFSHFIIPFCGWLLMCHIVKKKNSSRTGTILLLWYFPSIAPGTKHPLDACMSERLHSTFPVTKGGTCSLPQQWEAEKPTPQILTCTVSFWPMNNQRWSYSLTVYTICLGRGYITRLTNMSSSSLPSHPPSQTHKGNLATASPLQWAKSGHKVPPFTETAGLSLPQVDHGCSLSPDYFMGTQTCKPQKTAIWQGQVAGEIPSHVDRISCCCHAEMISYNFRRW